MFCLFTSTSKQSYFYISTGLILCSCCLNTYCNMSGSISPGTLVGAGGDGGGAPSPPPAHGDDAAGDERPMTYDEKRTLSLGINMLNGSLLGRVIQIIQSMQPGTGDDDTNEFEIDFEKLNPSTLRALERFVKSKVPYVYEQQHSDHDDEL